MSHIYLDSLKINRYYLQQSHGEQAAVTDLASMLAHENFALFVVVGDVHGQSLQMQVLF